MSSARGYVPSVVDRDWIESLAEPLHPSLVAIEAAAEPESIPILDREAGRVLSVLAAGLVFWAVWRRLGQRAGGTSVTIGRDGSRTDRARAWWRAAGIADERITVVNRPALEALAAGSSEAALDGPFDLVFIDALKEEYQAYVEALVPRLVPGALVVADNVLWSGQASGDRPNARGSATESLRAFDRAMLRDPRFDATILPVGDGLLIAGYRG